MEAPHVAIRGAALQIDGRRTLLYGGELQYFRVRDRHGNAARTFDMWAERLDALAEAGLNAISTYIPWDGSGWRLVSKIGVRPGPRCPRPARCKPYCRTCRSPSTNCLTG